MKKWIYRIFLLLVFGAFLTASVMLLMYFTRYRLSSDTRQEAVQEYTQPSKAGKAKTDPSYGQASGENQGGGSPEAAERERAYSCAPIEVDFERLCRINGDIIGWIYCEGTVINYPVVYGRDNEYYLERDYRGTYDPSGSIFTDMRNKDGFNDANVILYGHHMQDGTMLASLKNWYSQEYYEEHPVMWLLTPEQDYRVDLFAGYVTTSGSDTYQVFHTPGAALGEYLNWVRKWSEFRADVDTGPDSRYIVLSTCAYSTEDARTVLHGKLVPVASAGGVPFA